MREAEKLVRLGHHRAFWILHNLPVINRFMPDPAITVVV